MHDQWLTTHEVPLGETLTLHSASLGEDRQVHVRLPLSYARTDHRYPVVVALDGELARFTAYSGTIALTSEWEGGVPELILVAVPNTDRFRDMLPSAITRPNEERRRGAAEAFLNFVHGELLPLIDRRYRTHPFRVLVGTSASGLTVIYEMMMHPGRFQAYMASSPSLQWDTDHAIRQLGEVSSNAVSSNTALSIWCGEHDNPGIRDACEEYREALLAESISNLRFHFNVYSGAGHCPSEGFRESLHWIFSTWAVPDVVLDDGIDAVHRHYQELSELLGFMVEPSAVEHGGLAFRWLARGRVNEAIKWISGARSDMPDSPDLAFFHGAVLFRTDRLDEAHAVVTTALQDHPRYGRLITLLGQIESRNER